MENLISGISSPKDPADPKLPTEDIFLKKLNKCIYSNNSNIKHSKIREGKNYNKQICNVNHKDMFSKRNIFH